MLRVTVLVLGCAMMFGIGTAGAVDLTVTQGITYLPGGTYEYDSVSLTGGALYLQGDVTMNVSGDFTMGTAGAIRCMPGYGMIVNQNGTDGAPGGASQAGGPGEDMIMDDGTDGYDLHVYADGDITLHGLVCLTGGDGDTHWSNCVAGSGGDGGAGPDGGPIGGNGGDGGDGGDSVGGDGGDGGSIHFETEYGTIDAGQSTSARLNVASIGGDAGDASNGGGGGKGGAGGDASENGFPGTGGNGGDGGNSIGGNGGNGGNVFFRAAVIHDDYLSLNVPGGAAGEAKYPGSGGSLGYGGTAENWNPNIGDWEIEYGLHGSPGVDGFSADGQPGEEGSYSFEFTGTAPEPLVGDLNGDGIVGSADLDCIRAHWGETRVRPGDLTKGDVSGDGIIGSADLDIIRGNWGATTSASAVPEPGLAMLLLLACAGVSCFRRVARS